MFNSFESFIIFITYSNFGAIQKNQEQIKVLIMQKIPTQSDSVVTMTYVTRP